MSAVTSIQEFKTKYGTKGWRLLVEEFINRAPTFRGDTVLAKGIGEMMADLESALKEEKP